MLPDTPHTLWNAGGDEMHAVVELRPGLRIESFFETMFGLARDGKTDRRGIPSPLQSAVIARAFRDEIRPPVVPGPAVTAVASVLAPFGRRRGYRARYPRYGDRASSEQ